MLFEKKMEHHSVSGRCYQLTESAYVGMCKYCLVVVACCAEDACGAGSLCGAAVGRAGMMLAAGKLRVRERQGLGTGEGSHCYEAVIHY